MRREMIVVAEGMSKVRFVLLLWMLTSVTFATTDQRFATSQRKLLLL